VERPEIPRTLDEADVDPDPIRQFRRWFDEAVAAGQAEPEAMALATSTPAAEPSLRFVLMRGLDERGFVFYTNEQSRKGEELAANPVAALAFRWWRLERQVRVTGPVDAVAPEESDAYFASRPRGAQISAWASAQSQPVPNRQRLEAEHETVANRYAGQDVPRPPWWRGFRVHPVEMEFWQGRPDRLHDRIRYRRRPAGDTWSRDRLSP
jgi:pyridoxamine 5'-phosphate oxidase